MVTQLNWRHAEGIRLIKTTFSNKVGLLIAMKTTEALLETAPPHLPGPAPLNTCLEVLGKMDDARVMEARFPHSGSQWPGKLEHGLMIVYLKHGAVAFSTR